MIAIDCQTFFETKLEPVAAGDTVPGPVMEIFMRDHRLNTCIVGIGCGLRVGQHIFVVEDVKPLILHRAHIEIGHGNDVEDVKIIFAPELLFVPAHRAFQCIHRIECAAFLAMFDIDRQIDRTPRLRGEMIFHDAKRSGNKREEIGWFRMWILPNGEMPVRLTVD